MADLKRLFNFAAHVTLKSLVSLVCRVIARGARIERRTHTHTTHRSSTVTLAAHARRGLTRYVRKMIGVEAKKKVHAEGQ